ncbi:MAG: PorP/SprF family type IX secretion system membrane protein [Fimbriimonadaceae bacterium]|nr:PorP/SprF family type IX secretion system membrane protein [Chitinophagales bacterium]
MNKVREKITQRQRKRFAHIARYFRAVIFFDKKIQYLFFVLFLICCKSIFSQDLRFTQFHASDTWLNPAFAGNKGQPRLEINFRDQWPAIPQTYVSYRIAFDAAIEDLNSGIGLFIVRDDEGQSILKTQQFGAQYMYQVQLTKQMALNTAVQASYTQRSIDWNELQFYDQINPIYGFTDATGNPNPISQTPPSQFEIHYSDFAAGALLFTNKWYAGISASHLTQPDQSFYTGNESKLPLTVTVQSGLQFYDDQKLYPFVVNPLALFTLQKDYKQMMAGSYFKKGNLLAGAFTKYNFQHLTDVSALIGLRKGWMTFAYSYDVPLGALSGASGGAHEVSIVVLFMESSSKMTTKRQKRSLECPSIL